MDIIIYRFKGQNINCQITTSNFKDKIVNLF
jgi:hypothetical protein